MKTEIRSKRADEQLKKEYRQLRWKRFCCFIL